MDVNTALTKISYALRGIDDDAPTFGDAEATYWLSILNDKKDELYTNPNVAWDSIFSPSSPNELGTVTTAGDTTLTGAGTYFTDYRVGDTILVSGETVRTIDTIISDTALTVTVAFSTSASSLTYTHTSIIAAGVQSYNLHRSFINPSDQVAVGTTYFDFTQPGARNSNLQEVYISGENPKVLTFTRTITATDDIVGGSLATAGFFLPNDLTAGTDLLPFPDPNWGVLATAAEVAFGDIIYEDKAGDLQNKANNLLKRMVSVTRKGTYGRPRRLPYNVKNRIIDPSNVK